jgi:hypothetical protein
MGRQKKVLSRLLSTKNRPPTVKQQEEEDQRVRELMTGRSAKRKLQGALDTTDPTGETVVQDAA